MLHNLRLRRDGQVANGGCMLGILRGEVAWVVGGVSLSGLVEFCGSGV